MDSGFKSTITVLFYEKDTEDCIRQLKSHPVMMGSLIYIYSCRQSAPQDVANAFNDIYCILILLQFYKQFLCYPFDFTRFILSCMIL